MNTNTLEILVIEDNQSHLADARKIFEERAGAGVPLRVDYASTLEEANAKLQSCSYGAIMTDVFFPEKDGDSESANGVKIGEYALQHQIPFVMVTSTYHHGGKTEPVNQWTRQRGVKLVDCDIQELVDRDELRETSSDLAYKKLMNGEGKKKNWGGAYLALSYFVEAAKEGNVRITSEGVIDARKFAFGSATSALVESNPLSGQTQMTDELKKRMGQDLTLARVVENYGRGMYV